MCLQHSVTRHSFSHLSLYHILLLQSQKLVMTSTKAHEDIIASLEAISHASFDGNEVERLRVRAAARRLLARVESPYERAWGFCFEHPVVFAALQTCVELGLWTTWTASGGGEKSIHALVNLTTKAGTLEPNLLLRLFRLLAAFNVVEETGENTFKPTAFSHAIGDESTQVRASLEAANNQYIMAGHNLPKYLAKIGYKEPTATEVNNYSDSDPDGLNFFARLQTTPKFYEDFTGHMEAWTAWKTPWTKIYDPSKLLNGARVDNNSPLVVDVGGNTGIDISHVARAQPDLPSGALVLQDLPEIISKVKVDDRVTAMAHDFWQPQPVKGELESAQHSTVRSVMLIRC